MALDPTAAAPTTPKTKTTQKVKDFIKKHKTPIIAGAIATTGLVLLQKFRPTDDSDWVVVEAEIIEPEDPTEA